MCTAVCARWQLAEQCELRTNVRDGRQSIYVTVKRAHQCGKLSLLGACMR
jgi:hypothetical protein